MEEVRQLVQEEGREARNLVAFHVAVDTPGKKPPWLMYPWCPARVSRKPPRGGATSAGAGSANPPRRPAPNTVHLRSASAGRDKRTELRARYWALLFGDLQRAIGEIYNTVEAHENLNECQEVILVLENYMRDFKALCEWFRLKWEYDNTPPPQRPQSLAWEIRKTDFVRPESRRTYSVKSSPSASGKNSPCLSGHNTPSGKNSPNLTGKTSPGSGKVSPRVSGQSNVSPKVNIEFLSNKAAIKSEPKTTKDISRLSDIKEKDIKENAEEIGIVDVISSKDNDDKSVNQTTVEIGKAKECPNTCPRQVVIKSPKRTVLSQDMNDSIYENISSQAKATIFKLDTMENEFLVKQLTDNKAKNENQLNRDKEFEYTKNYSQKFGSQENNSSLENNVIEKGHETPIDKKISVTSNSSEKSGDNFVDMSNDSSYKHTDRKLAMTEKNNLCEINVITEPIIAEVTDIEEKNTKLSPSTKLIEKDDRKENASNSFQEEVVDLKTDVDSIKLFHIDTSNVKDVKKDMDPKKIDSKTMTEKQARPAYSQAAAKPKPTSTLKTELKTPNTTTRLIVRSKTVVEIRPNPTPKPLRQLPKRNQTNKCSYPFNLTTGRTSLFDGPSNKALSKKPINRIQTSGDVKTNPKVDLKKPPSRPINLKINEKGDKKEIMNTTLENIKDCEEYSSCDTIITQIDISRIESNESLKTLVPEDADITNSIEMLNVTNNRNDNDGWLTVKSRRLSRESKKQSKSHWANRFHQPSATTSLPTLNMIISPKQEIKQIVNNTKLDRAQSEQPQNKPKVSKPKETKKDLAMIRQKSDVTGLKTRTSRSKALKREKLKDMSKEKGKLIKNRLHSSLESLTTGLARSQESTQDAFDFDKWKAEFKSTLNFLDEDDQIPNHNEILKSADPSEMSEIAEMTSQIEENEKKISWALDFQSEVDQRKLCEEEDLLNRQIMELQQVSDVDLDTETDDTETDAEILCEDSTPGPSSPSVENLRSLAASLEDQYETALAGMSWAERVDTLGALEALVARDPGRAQQLHAKLSQGIKRRGSLQDALRRLQAKQARAERQRLEYQTERAKKIHQLLARVEEVKVAKNQLIDEKRIRMERRLQKAAENRDQYLKDIVRKAHDEEEKLREIAFIKQLEAENRRHEFLDQCRSHTTRLRQMRRDRLSKLEQKAAREAAVGARRQALELARKLHVETLLERRKERDARLEELKELKKQERGDAAREKAEGVKSRLSALAAAAELEADALRSRIRDKQDASQQRLESHLQAIREKATGPRQPTTSESQDQSTKEEKELQEEAERLEQERKEKEKQKAIKKKARKVKQKLLSTSNETIVRNDLSIHSDITIPGSNKILKVIHQLSNMITPLQKTDSIERNNENETADTEHTKNKKSAKYKNKTLIEDAEDKSFKKNENNNNNNVETVAIKIETLNGDYKDKTSKNKNNNKNIENSVKNKNEALNGDANDKTMNVNENKNDEISHKDKNETTNSESNNKKSNKTINKNIEILKSEECNSKNQNANIDNAKIENVSAKKKNKKSKGDRSDQPKLSKTSSVCSSLSDMSRGSCKSDKRSRQVIDMPYLERLLNELHRLMEKIDRSDKSSYIRVLVVKVLGQLISVAAEREEFAPQFTIKSLATAVVIISRVLATCSRSAAYFMGASACVHTVKLLSNQLERDLLNDPKEMELTKQLCDCLSLGLDSVLCSSRLYDESKCSAKELELLTTLRSRTHTLISYICLSGCITRAEKAGEVREAVQTLLTVCADLCHPFGADEGPELPSAVQSLRCALGTGVCGSRAEFCMLFAHGAGLQHGGGFVRAARTAHLLRGLAHLDHQIVQDAFGEGGWPLEFRAAVARLLSQHAPNDKEAPRTKALRISNQRLDQSLSETMVLDLIVLVGFVVVNNPQLQETICDGWSVIKTLCTLPANWLVSRPHCHALLPTLVALSDCPTAQATIAAELNIGMLEEYMRSPEAQEVKLVQVIKQGRVKKSGKK